LLVPAKELIKVSCPRDRIRARASLWTTIFANGAELTSRREEMIGRMQRSDEERDERS